MAFRFVHSADLHLDSPLRSLALRNGELASLVGGAGRIVLERIVALCLEERVDALLLAGDIFDGDLRSMKTAAFFARQMHRLAEADIPVFMVRGNHDAASRLMQTMDLPGNVRIFSTRGESFVLEDKNVALHGVSLSKGANDKSLLPKFPAPREGMLNIGMLHTSLAGSGSHDRYAPCSAAELAETGHDYWALGHIHRRELVMHKKGCTIVMPGIPQGRHVNESGPKSVTMVRLGKSGKARLEEHFPAVARFERINIDISGAREWGEIVKSVRRAVQGRLEKMQAEVMIARLELSGACVLNSRLRRNREYLVEEMEHLAGECGPVHFEKIELETSPPVSRPGAAGNGSSHGDPLQELRAIAASAQMIEGMAKGEFARLVEELRNALPPELRCRFDFEGREHRVKAMLEAGLEDVLAHLEEEAREAQ